jgi:hypothetical protein
MAASRLISATAPSRRGVEQGEDAVLAAVVGVGEWAGPVRGVPVEAVAVVGVDAVGVVHISDADTQQPAASTPHRTRDWASDSLPISIVFG